MLPMGYNLTVKTVERMRDKLEVLYETRQTRDFPSSNPRSLAYKLREAIRASAIHNKYRHFSELSFIYKIRTLEGSVRAEYQGFKPHAELVRPAREEDPGSEVIVQAETLHIPEADTLFDIFGAGLKFSQGTPEIHFPHIQLEHPELESLLIWCSQFGWKLINHGEGGITLTKRDVDEAILWRPE